MQSLTRAMKLLETIADRGEIGVTELARSAGLHVATTHNLLRTLAAGGYVLNLDGRYSIGPALGWLAMCWSPLAALPHVAEQPMKRMSAACGETGSLGLLVGDACRVVPVSHGTDDVVARTSLRVFDRPLAVATGRLMVAFADAEQQARVAEAHAAERRDLAAAEWLAELASVRRERCAVVCRDGPGVVDAVAVPVYGPRGQVLAALGAHCPNFRGTPRHLVEILQALQAAAADVSQLLGGRFDSASAHSLRAAVRRQSGRRDSRNRKTGRSK